MGTRRARRSLAAASLSPPDPSAAAFMMSRNGPPCRPRPWRPPSAAATPPRWRSSALGDVVLVISNCVINLSSDKDRVLSEACRVLRPGGRFAVSDIVLRGPVPAELRRDAELWAGCVSSVP
jgi:SAM-dependent methyltransferase